MAVIASEPFEHNLLYRRLRGNYLCSFNNEINFQILRGPSGEINTSDLGKMAFHIEKSV